MPDPDVVIIKIMCRCYLHCSCTEFHVYYYGICDYGDATVGDERMLDKSAVEVLRNGKSLGQFKANWERMLRCIVDYLDERL